MAFASRLYQGERVLSCHLLDPIQQEVHLFHRCVLPPFKILMFYAHLFCLQETPAEAGFNF